MAEDCTHWSPEREAVVFPLFIKILSDLDHALGETIENLSSADRVVVSSDHGMSAIDLVVRPNVLFEACGYLKRTTEGDIDVAGSLIFYHPAESGLVCFNAKLCGLQGVSVERLSTDVLERIQQVTKRVPQILCYPDFEEILAPPNWLTARHFLSVGRYVQAKADLDGALMEPSVKTGEHVVCTNERQLIGTVLDISHEGRNLVDLMEAKQLRALLSPARTRRATSNVVSRLI